MNISVCVPTYNRPDQVTQLLGNLLQQTSLPDEVLLIDASPDERTRAVVMNAKGSLPMLRHEVWSKGLTRQRNRAIELAQGDVLLFLDDDIILEPDFIARLRNIFADDQQHGVSGLTGILINETPKAPGLGWRLKRYFGIIETDQPGKLLACGETTPLPRPQPEQMFDVDYLPGGFTAWRREVFASFRYAHFFEGYGLGEDKYFSSCVRRRFRLCVHGALRGSHLHVAGNRPNFFRWGLYNVYNHHFIMQECSSGCYKVLRFYAFHIIDCLNDLFSWPLRKNRIRTLLYGLGRACGLLLCLLAKPRMSTDDPAQINAINM